MIRSLLHRRQRDAGPAVQSVQHREQPVELQYRWFPAAPPSQFQDLLYQNMVMPGAAATQQTTVAAGLQNGLGTRSSCIRDSPVARRFDATGNPLDLAIEGQDFFR